MKCPKILADRTLRIRHNLVRIIAPRLFDLHSPYSSSLFVRPMIQFIHDNIIKTDLVGAEIGVGRGRNAESILKTLPMKHLFLIDPYIPYTQKLSDKNGYRMGDYSDALEIAKLKLSKFSDKITFVRKKSEDAVNEISDNLDFVYIDGNHDYSFVKKDMEMYFPKIVSGGVLGGHDFSANYLGVCMAVVEFAFASKLELYARNTDWWMMQRTQKGAPKSEVF